MFLEQFCYFATLQSTHAQTHIYVMHIILIYIYALLYSDFVLLMAKFFCTTSHKLEIWGRNRFFNLYKQFLRLLQLFASATKKILARTHTLTHSNAKPIKGKGTVLQVGSQ